LIGGFLDLSNTVILRSVAAIGGSGMNFVSSVGLRPLRNEPMTARYAAIGRDPLNGGETL
jgi:hypothetical protein